MFFGFDSKSYFSFDSKNYFSFDSKNFFYDSENYFFIWLQELFFHMTLRIDPSSNMILRNELQKNDSKDWPFFLYVPNDWTFSDMTQGLFSLVTQRNEHFFEYDWKKWTFWIRLKELNLFEDHLTPRCFTFFVTREMELFFFQFGSRNWDLFFNNITQKWLTLFEHDSQNWILFFNMTHRIEPFWKTWFIEIEPFFSTWLEKKMSLLYKMYDFNYNWSFLEKCTTQLELIVFFFLKEKMTLRIEPFLEFDSMDWTFFQYDSKNCLRLVNITRRIEPSFWICLNE